MKSTPLLMCLGLLASVLPSAPAARADGWKTDPIWHDGLVEKAVYSASRVVYGAPRPYEMIIFTNKEMHDRKTLTKAEKSKSQFEVFKHNHIETIPTPNYPYHYETTTHLTTSDLSLIRLDCSSQEFCGTSFKQFARKPGDRSMDYWSFSYMPEAGRKQGTVSASRRIVAEDSLPLALRDFDFAGKATWSVALLPSQKSNRPTPHEPLSAEVRYAGEEGDAHKLEVHAEGKLLGTYWMAKDRLHVMTRYMGVDGQTYELKSVERVNYWTIRL